MDMDSAAPLFQKAADAFTALIRTHSEKDSREGLSALNALAERHIFFEPLRQDWRDRISTAQTLDRYTENELCSTALRRLPENLKLIQEQTRRFFSCVLDMDNGGENNPFPVKMAEYLGGSEGSAFQFTALAMRFELLGQYGPTNVLYPKSIYDLVDYHLRECVNRRVRLRIRKHCGHYFPVRGRITALARLLKDIRYLGDDTYPPIVMPEEFGNRKTDACGKREHPEIKDIRYSFVEFHDLQAPEHPSFLNGLEIRNHLLEDGLPVKAELVVQPQESGV